MTDTYTNIMAGVFLCALIIAALLVWFWMMDSRDVAANPPVPIPIYQPVPEPDPKPELSSMEQVLNNEHLQVWRLRDIQDGYTITCVYTLFKPDERQQQCWKEGR